MGFKKTTHHVVVALVADVPHLDVQLVESQAQIGPPGGPLNHLGPARRLLGQAVGSVLDASGDVLCFDPFFKFDHFEFQQILVRLLSEDLYFFEHFEALEVEALVVQNLGEVNLLTHL